MYGKKDKLKNRIAAFESVRQKMSEEGYREQIHTISIVKANLMAIVTTIPIILLFSFLYLKIWDTASIAFDFPTYLLFLAAIIASCPIHELIHGITWSLFCKNGWKSIHLGMEWKMLTPYCHCEEPLPFAGYFLGGLMPLFLLGVGVYILAFILGNSFLLVFGFISILGAGGDLTIALKLIKYHDGQIYDHPTECGFVVFSK